MQRTGQANQAAGTAAGTDASRLVLRHSDRVERRGVMAALDAAQCLIWFDAQGRLVDANENTQSMLAMPLQDLGMMDYGSLVGDPEAHAHHTRKRWGRIRDGLLRSEERGLFAADGSEIWCSLTYAAIRSEQGGTRRVLAIAIDMTPWSWRNEGPARAR